LKEAFTLRSEIHEGLAGLHNLALDLTQQAFFALLGDLSHLQQSRE
jgi:hypothetical protein